MTLLTSRYLNTWNLFTIDIRYKYLIVKEEEDPLNFLGFCSFKLNCLTIDKIIEFELI